MKRIGRLERPSRVGNARMFKHPVLEKLTRTHIGIPIAIYMISGGFSMYHAITKTNIPFVIGLGIFISGYIIFTLTEYCMHRYFYHMVPNGKWKDKIQYTVHGVHHDYPGDKMRLAMPPFVSIFYAVALYFIFQLLIGKFSLYFLPGFLIGYATYLFIHYAIHVFPAPKGWLKSLWVNHAIHHYKDPDVAFGVSTSFWDRVFGTMPQQARKR